MRLLVITTNFPRWEGDPHSPWLVELLSRLQGQGIQVDVLAPSFRGQGSHRVHGFPVHRFRYGPAAWETLTHEEGAPAKIRRNPLYLLLVPLYLAAGLAAAVRLVRYHPYQVIHVHWPIPQGLLGWAARTLAPNAPRLVATFYGADLVLVRRFPGMARLARAFVARCDDVAAISTYTRRELERLSGRSARLLPYGISLPPPQASWPAEPGKILFVGRLIPRKGGVYLVRALALLQDLPWLHLVMVGDGPEAAAIQAEVRRLGLEERVTLTGRISDEALERHYRTCQLFVLPAIVDDTGDTEMLGMVLLEAMRYRKPVVASRVGGIPDIVQDDRNGLLVPEKDPPALAQAIRRVLQEPGLARRLGDAGYTYARERFSWDAVLAETLSMYGAPTTDSK